MKKLLALLFATVLLFAACAEENKNESSAVNTDSSIASKEDSSAEASADSSVEANEVSEEASNESSDSVATEIINFEYTTIYTDKLRSDGIFPYGNVFNSLEALNSYNADNKENHVFATDITVDEVPSYDEWTQKYTDDWFKEHTLLAVVVENKFGVLPSVRLVEKAGNKITVCVSNVNRQDEALTQYHIFVEIEKIDVSDVDVFEDYEGSYSTAKNCALDFFEAYAAADIDTAKMLADSPNNPCFEYFVTEPIGEVTHCEYEFTDFGYDKEAKLHTVILEIEYDVGNNEYTYMFICLATEKLFKGEWKVTYYDFEA